MEGDEPFLGDDDEVAYLKEYQADLQQKQVQNFVLHYEPPKSEGNSAPHGTMVCVLCSGQRKLLAP